MILGRKGRFACFVIALLGATSGWAQEAAWTPPPPSNEERDWIHLSSGEWLWGTIELMRDESLEFDSEELDLVTIDWEDIAEIRSARIMTYVMRDETLVTGTSTLAGQTLRVTSVAGDQQFPRNQIEAILAGRPTEWNFWSAKVGMDLKIRTGNTNQQDFGSRIFLKREAPGSRIDLRYQGNYSEIENIETVRNHRTNAEWKIFLSRRFFVTPVNDEFFVDAFQNIGLRSSIGAGVGYYLSRSKNADWYVDLGGAYQRTRYSSVAAGEEGIDTQMTLPLRTTLETDVTDNIELTAEYGVQLGLGSGANSLHHTFILLEFDLFGDVDFTASMTWDHATRPKANAEGVAPLKDDLAMAYGLAVDF
ncbi:MAG: DUF481 domain-containing protein [Candidatus Krumholzibacteria bacterium]|nr:DUF481 domain-containing protein [Candidatus Krumholzibacteria bacterium]